jgi:hypothetical protein
MHLIVIASGVIACIYFFWLCYTLLKDDNS